MKTIPLTLANLKGFMRDWKYVTVLIILPLVIVGMIFASFGYDSINIPIGTVNNADEFEYGNFTEEADENLQINDYNSIQACLDDLTEYEVYGCIEFEPNEGDDRFTANIFYDNTKNRIGRRIRMEVEQISADFNLNYSEDRANETLENISDERKKLEDIQSNFTEFDDTLYEKIEFLDTKIGELEGARQDLRDDAEDLRETQEESREILEDIREHNQRLNENVSTGLRTTGSNLQRLDNLSRQNQQRKLRALQGLQQTNQSLQNYRENVEEEFERYQEISLDENSLADTEERYIDRLDETIGELQDSRDDLKDSREDIDDINETVENTMDFYDDLEDFNATRVATSVEVNDRGVYRTRETSLADIDIGEPDELNLLRLQTIFSTILVFISLFVSILVSQFITVKFINSKTVKRLKMVEGISFSEYLSVFLSSLIIITIPMISVILFGQYLFELPIFDKIGQTALIVGLLCAAVVNFGIGIAYLVKEKSITLLIGNLLLVFLSFFSGFILPLAMMTPLLGGFGSIQPASLAQDSFDLIVLYNQPLGDIQTELIMMAGWVVALGAVAFKIKEHEGV